MAQPAEFGWTNGCGWRSSEPTATLNGAQCQTRGSTAPSAQAGRQIARDALRRLVQVPSFRLIPREERFFDLFVEDAANVLDGARQLEAMLRSFDNPDKSAKKIRETEHRGDDISHDIGRRLESTFVTPFDREEIHALISGLDDILDMIEEVADTFVLYRIDAPTKASVKQAALVVQACETIHQALSNLRGFKDIDRFITEVHRIENEGDRISRSAIAGLFDDGTKTIDVLKWKDVYALLEDTIDKCEDVADLIERIVVMHA
jgi:predicted phosphate transport protein (TIGR00153 family)